MTLDLNGKSLYVTSDYALKIDGGTVKITSSAKGGRIEGAKWGSVYVDDASVTIGSNVTVDYKASGYTGVVGAVIVHHPDAEVTLDGGTLTSSQERTVAMTKGTFTLTSGSIVNSSATGYGIYPNSGCVVNLNGGSVEAAAYGVFVYLDATVTVTGTQISHGTTGADFRYYYCDLQYGTLDLTNATGTEYTISIDSSGDDMPVAYLKYATARHAITSATYTDDTNTYFEKGTTVTLSCAHPSNSSEATCMAEAVCAVCKQPHGDKDSSNHTSISEDGLCECGVQFAAVIIAADETKTYYDTFANAITAAQSSTTLDTVLKLLQDQSGSYSIDRGTFTLDLNGKTIDAGTSSYGLRIYGTIKITGKGTVKAKSAALWTSSSNVTVENGTFSGEYGMAYSSSANSLYVSGDAVFEGTTADLYAGGKTLTFTDSITEGSYSVQAYDGTVFAKGAEGVTLDPDCFTAADAGYVIVHDEDANTLKIGRAHV